jgi:hypothetical protein
MSNKLLHLTPDQLIIYKQLEEIRMAWTAFWFVMPLFTIGFLAFIAAIFWVREQTLAKALTGGVDFLLGTSVKSIISYLFPKKSA